MAHAQPATPIATDNNTASDIAMDSVKQKRSMTCASAIGSATVFDKANFKFSGAKTKPIVQTIFPIVIRLHIIKPSNQHVSSCPNPSKN